MTQFNNVHPITLTFCGFAGTKVLVSARHKITYLKQIHAIRIIAMWFSRNWIQLSFHTPEQNEKYEEKKTRNVE